MDYKNCCRFLYLLKTASFFEWDTLLKRFLTKNQISFDEL